MDFEKNYQNNMTFLKDFWPGVYENLLKANINDYQLVLNDNNEINISVNGNLLYPENIEESVNQQMEVFLKERPSYYRKPSWSAILGEDYIHDEFIIGLEKESPYIKEKIHFKDYSHNLENYFPFLLIFGIGSGLHIQKLIEQSDEISDIIIVDESYEFLKISMHLFDWEPILKYFKKNHRTLHFVINDHPLEVSNNLLNIIFKNFPYYFFYVTYLTHYNSDFFTKTKEEFLKKFNLGFTGLGFYDDELISLKHTIENIKDDKPIFKYTDKLPRHSSAFIIGSGPSIDNDIKNIKNLQDKAVIFSCGTSLKILYENGITPDYHIEMERPPEMIKILEDNLPDEYLKTIDIIGLNVVYKALYDKFKSAKIFFRENDAGSTLSPDNIPILGHCNPTVVNATITFASEIGFENIFLFGADMGYKDPNQHHSKSSPYYKGSLKDHYIPSVEAKYNGNFNKNEKFFSTDILLWCKQRVENCIVDYILRKKKSINYFNCSDGLDILRCSPIKSKNVTLKKDLNKKDVLTSIENSFDRNFDSIHIQTSLKLEQQKKILFEDIKSIRKLIKAKKITTFDQFFVLVKRSFSLVNHLELKEGSSLSRSMIKGTLYHFITSVYSHALAGTDKKASLDYINESLNKLLKFLDTVENEIESLELNYK